MSIYFLVTTGGGGGVFFPVKKSWEGGMTHNNEGKDTRCFQKKQ